MPVVRCVHIHHILIMGIRACPLCLWLMHCSSSSMYYPLSSVCVCRDTPKQAPPVPAAWTINGRSCLFGQVQLSQNWHCHVCFGIKLPDLHSPLHLALAQVPSPSLALHHYHNYIRLQPLRLYLRHPCHQHRRCFRHVACCTPLSKAS